MKKSLVKAIALTAAMSLATVNLSMASGGNIGHGDISIYKDGAIVSKLSGQNPIEDSSFMVCDGQCLVKSEGISLLVSDQSKMAVANETDLFNLYVKEGSINYVINSNARKIAFHTPDGSHTVAEVVFDADSGSVVKGNVAVSSEGAEISVSEGRMVFTTAEGMEAVDANNKIVLAMGEVPAGTSPWVWVGGAAAVGLGIWAIVELTEDDDDDPVVIPPAKKQATQNVNRRPAPLEEEEDSSKPASPPK